jgi:hypothetical protein
VKVGVVEVGVNPNLTNHHETPTRATWVGTMDFLYFALFALLALNGLVVVLALSHAMNNRE